MADERETGGPAFPTFQAVQSWDDDKGKYRERIEPMGGMELRDWFAGQALIGLLARADREPVFVSTEAYEFADAMLEARK